MAKEWNIQVILKDAKKSLKTIKEDLLTEEYDDISINCFYYFDGNIKHKKEISEYDNKDYNTYNDINNCFGKIMNIIKHRKNKAELIEKQVNIIESIIEKAEKRIKGQNNTIKAK